MPDEINKGSLGVVSYGADGEIISTPPNYTDLAQIVSIEPPELQADDIETSHMLTTDQIKTFVAGWADAGEMKLTAQFVKAQYALAIGTLFRATRAYKFTDAAGNKLECIGYIKQIGMPVDREKLITNAITIKVSGGLTFTPAA